MIQMDERNLTLRLTRVLFSLTKKLLTIVLLAHVSHTSASSLFEEENDRKELPFVLRTNDVEHSIKVRIRGKSCRRVCTFLPLRINFAVDGTAQSIFEGQDKLKLVTHCREYNSAQLDTLEEYAAYRIFNLISDVSYKVRLLHITYTDTDGRLKENTFDRYGFL